MLFLCCFLLSFFSGNVYAEEPNYAIEVGAHRNFEIFVAPVEVINASEKINATIPDDLIFGYVSTHYYMLEIDNRNGGYEPFRLNNKGKMSIYNSDTIEYVWDNCDYDEDPMKCSFENNHWIYKTKVTVTDDQVTIAMYLYDSELQIISRGIITKTHSIKVIPQQKTTSRSQPQRMPAMPIIPKCVGEQCPPGLLSPNMMGNQPQQTIVEDLEPVVIEIPPRVLTGQFHQASLRLWAGAKYSFD